MDGEHPGVKALSVYQGRMDAYMSALSAERKKRQKECLYFKQKYEGKESESYSYEVN